MLKGTWKSFYSLFGPSASPPLLLSLSSWLGSYSSASASSSPVQPSSSISLNLNSGGGGLAVVTLYKAIAFLALLSLIPSSPPSSIITSASMIKEADLQKIFKVRNENEWKSLWHSEKHVRCRDQLLMHMDWACQKDIYRLEKRFQRAPFADREPLATPGTVNSDNDPIIGVDEVFIGKDIADTVIKPWSGYLRRKREEKSITDECCSIAGCTWEEYAEYCPAHRRIQSRRISKRK